MSKTILSLWGPNCDQLGTRDPSKYGTETLDEHVAAARSIAEAADYTLEHLQTASQAEAISTILAARGRVAAIVINPGAFTHYAWGIHDALEIYDGVVIEVHLSNPQAREAWRHTSVVSPVAKGTIVGFGGLGFRMGIEAAIGLTSD
jgi:3-dehydroquinate dehydratase II